METQNNSGQTAYRSSILSYSFATVLHLLPCLAVLSELYQRQWWRYASEQNTLDVGPIILLIHSGFLSYKDWSYKKQV